MGDRDRCTDPAPHGLVTFAGTAMAGAGMVWDWVKTTAPAAGWVLTLVAARCWADRGRARAR